LSTTETPSSPFYWKDNAVSRGKSTPLKTPEVDSINFLKKEFPVLGNVSNATLLPIISLLLSRNWLPPSVSFLKSSNLLKS
jgi:hypothetical protein